MRILFVHDHPFRRVGNLLFSTGALSNDVLTRYAKMCDELVVFARIRDEIETNNRWSQIINPKITIIGKNNVSTQGLQKEINKADCIIIRLPSVMGLAAVFYARQICKPYFIEVVGCIWDALWNHGIKGKILAPFMFVFNRLAIKNAPYVLYVTSYFLQKRYPSSKKNIGCSDVELHEFNQSVLNNRIQHINSNPHPLIIGTIGAVDVKYKGQEYVIRALGILKKHGRCDFSYQLVGNGNQEYLQKKAEMYGVSDCVVFKDGIPHEKIFDWLDSIDIYIQPSKTEGLPRSLIEAMSRGLPALGSNVGGIPELLDSDDLIKVGCSEEIAEKLDKLDSTTLIKKGIRNANKSIEFDKKTLDKRREVFYQDFLNECVIG